MTSPQAVQQASNGKNPPNQHAQPQFQQAHVNTTNAINQ